MPVYRALPIPVWFDRKQMDGSYSLGALLALLKCVMLHRVIPELSLSDIFLCKATTYKPLAYPIHMAQILLPDGSLR